MAKSTKSKTSTTSIYNATVYSVVNDKVSGCFVANVNENGKMLRSNWIQCTGYEGTEVYDEYLRLCHPNEDFVIVKDNGQGYKDRLCGLMLPPEYLAAAIQK
jgi:hypothetical protein